MLRPAYHLIVVCGEFTGQLAVSSLLVVRRREEVLRQGGGKEACKGCSRGTEQMGVGDKTRSKSDSTIIAF